jgi:hypothetical protein
MKPKFTVIVGTLMLFSIFGLLIAPTGMVMRVRAQNHEPELSDELVYTWENDVWFDVTYIDIDNDAGEVYLFLDDVQIEMSFYEGNPSSGWYFEINVAETQVTDQSEFYFYADDLNGSTTYLYDTGGIPFVLGDFIGGPVLSNADVSMQGDLVVFEVTYQHEEGELGTVWINFDLDTWHEMTTEDLYPVSGQKYSITFFKADLTHDAPFWFDAMDESERWGYLPEDLGDFYISDFVTEAEWGYEPVLSNPQVQLDGDNVVFSVTYQDGDGDIGTVRIYLGLSYYDMGTSDTNPASGQRYNKSFPKSNYAHDQSFHFEAWDGRGGHVVLNNSGPDFLISDFITEEQWEKSSSGNGDGGSAFGEGWFDNPEVMVGIIALVAMGAGSAYGIYHRKKKRGRFSELLGNLDEIYRSYKLNPHKCEIELEKMRAIINMELRRSVIDENNYSILKDRIDELVTEIRSDSLQSQVSELPKDIEMRVKDMLIDGKISRDEYDKLLPIITGSDMAAGDKEKMQKVLEGWVREDKKLDEK